MTKIMKPRLVSRLPGTMDSGFFAPSRNFWKTSSAVLRVVLLSFTVPSSAVFSV